MCVCVFWNNLSVLSLCLGVGELCTVPGTHGRKPTQPKHNKPYGKHIPHRTGRPSQTAATHRPTEVQPPIDPRGQRPWQTPPGQQAALVSEMPQPKRSCTSSRWRRCECTPRSGARQRRQRPAPPCTQRTATVDGDTPTTTRDSTVPTHNARGNMLTMIRRAMRVALSWRGSTGRL